MLLISMILALEMPAWFISYLMYHSNKGFFMVIQFDSLALGSETMWSIVRNNNVRVQDMTELYYRRQKLY